MADLRLTVCAKVIVVMKPWPNASRRFSRVLPVVVIAVALAGCTKPPGRIVARPSGKQNLLTAPSDIWFPIFDGSSLNGWKIVRDGMRYRGGEVTIENGMLVLGTGRPMTGVVWVENFPQENYEIAVEANRLDGSDTFCGMTFPVGNSYLALIVGGWDGTVVGLSNVDDLSADNNETTKEILLENERWYPIRLRISSAAVEVWLDGVQVIDLKRKGRHFSLPPEQHLSRPFGVNTYNTKAAFREFKFRNLGPEV